MDEYLQTALEAAKRADEVTMRYFHGKFDVELKSDSSPVTIADKEAEQVVIETIRKRYPNHSILGEETGTTNQGSEYTWTIDPIDGTKSFIKGIPLFGTQIGLFNGNSLELGVSSMPAMNELMSASRGEGAFRNGERIRVSQVDSIKKASICFSTLNHFRPFITAEKFFSLLEKPYRVRAYGDCYPFHLVADGRFDAVIQSRVKIWDIAAIAAIIEIAGGKCTDLGGNPIDMDSGTILASNGKFHDQLIDWFRA